MRLPAVRSAVLDDHPDSNANTNTFYDHPDSDASANTYYAHPNAYAHPIADANSDPNAHS